MWHSLTDDQPRGLIVTFEYPVTISRFLGNFENLTILKSNKSLDVFSEKIYYNCPIKFFILILMVINFTLRHPIGHIDPTGIFFSSQGKVPEVISKR